MPSLGSGFKRIAIVNASGWVLSDQTPDSNLGCGVAVTGQTRLQVVFFHEIQPFEVVQLAQGWISAARNRRGEGQTKAKEEISTWQEGTGLVKFSIFQHQQIEPAQRSVFVLWQEHSHSVASAVGGGVIGTLDISPAVLKPFLNLLEKGTSWGERDLDLDWTKKILSHQAWIQYLHICKTHTYI